VPAAVGESTGAVFRLQRPVGDWGQVHAGAAASNAAQAQSHDNFLPADAGADDVAVVRVTDAVHDAAAVKIDVEGSEAAAMRSCGSLLLDPTLQLAAIEFQGSSDPEYVTPFPQLFFVTSCVAPFPQLFFVTSCVAPFPQLFFVTSCRYSEGVFAQLLQQGLSAYIFQEEYFRSPSAAAWDLCSVACSHQIHPHNIPRLHFKCQHQR
jgi:hypothetical protein